MPTLPSPVPALMLRRSAARDDTIRELLMLLALWKVMPAGVAEAYSAPVAAATCTHSSALKALAPGGL